MTRPRSMARPACAASLHVTFPLLANLYLVLTLLATIFLLGDFNSVYLRHRRRPGQLDACAGDARHPQRL